MLYARYQAGVIRPLPSVLIALAYTRVPIAAQKGLDTGVKWTSYSFFISPNDPFY
jgi:hypothetical protein